MRDRGPAAARARCNALATKLQKVMHEVPGLSACDAMETLLSLAVQLLAHVDSAQRDEAADHLKTRLAEMINLAAAEDGADALN
jgi:hypothetical protein